MNLSRVVAIGPALTGPGPMRSAGLFYLQQVHAWLDEHTHLTVVAPSLGRPVTSTGPKYGNAHVVGFPSNTRQQILREARGRVENLARRIDPVLPPTLMAAAIQRDSALQAILAEADVVDLQWTEYIGLAPLVRRAAPQAHIVATFHDVMTQLMTRQAERATGPAATLLAMKRLRATRRRESRIARYVDTVLCLNPKDADLLGDLGFQNARVVDPPVAPMAPAERDLANLPTVGIVAAFGRDVNVAGAAWFVREIWPEVVSAVPNAVLRLIGNDPSGHAQRLATSSAAITATGFVDDLSAEYSRMWVNVVPLLMGSGIKFKTLEGMAHAVPTVSTSVGVEGIPLARDIEAVSNDPRRVARAIVRSLSDMEGAQRRANDIAVQTQITYGHERFEERLRSVYINS